MNSVTHFEVSTLLEQKLRKQRLTYKNYISKIFTQEIICGVWSSAARTTRRVV
jgi:hypothetical protein